LPACLKNYELRITNDLKIDELLTGIYHPVSSSIVIASETKQQHPIYAANIKKNQTYTGLSHIDEYKKSPG
jgi:hypothetical protein